MNGNKDHIPYASTGFFSRLVLDYLSKDPGLQPFYAFDANIEGIKKAIVSRIDHPVDRELLVSQLQQQYAGIVLSEKQQTNLNLLTQANCFTITTAHQPNIFTGHLYSVYKILHAIKLADQLKNTLRENDYVPVFYMGSEDADMEELGHIYLFGEKYEWATNQAGAFGRMKVDKNLVALIETIGGRLSVYPFGSALAQLLKSAYHLGNTMEQASFQLINSLFGEYGLLVLLPDRPEWKQAFIPVLKKELEERFSHTAVQSTVSNFPSKYNIQTSGRELNLFFLKDDLRERISFNGSRYEIHNTELSFSVEEMMTMLNEHPEYFSPNVILRPVFQELLLPNIAFIGGGGELAYWLELKKVFEAASVPYPVLVLRNSFLVINKEQEELMQKLKFSATDLFKAEQLLMAELVTRDSKVQLNLDAEKLELQRLYKKVQSVAGGVDASLLRHVAALEAGLLKKLTALEKKMLRAEKRKFEAEQRQLHKLKEQLFPHNSLQERIDNFMPFYAKWGPGFIELLYQQSGALEQEFTVLTEK